MTRAYPLPKKELMTSNMARALHSVSTPVRHLHLLHHKSPVCVLAAVEYNLGCRERGIVVSRYISALGVKVAMKLTCSITPHSDGPNLLIQESCINLLRLQLVNIKSRCTPCVSTGSRIVCDQERHTERLGSGHVRTVFAMEACSLHSTTGRISKCIDCNRLGCCGIENTNVSRANGLPIRRHSDITSLLHFSPHDQLTLRS
jgi:hypothetical protein